METRLSNIFKTTNVTNFTKAILKSYKSSISYIQIENTKTTRLLFKGSWILLYFWHSNWHNFGYISEKLQNHTFSKAHRSQNGSSNKLFFNFCLFPFSNFQMTIVLQFYYVTSIFDLHIFEKETADLSNFFEICTEMYFVSVFFLDERNITTSFWWHI